MPITPKEAAKHLDAKIAEQVKEQCIVIDTFISVHWHTGKSYLNMPSSNKMGSQAIIEIINIYDKSGWNVSHSSDSSHGNCWFQFKEKS